MGEWYDVCYPNDDRIFGTICFGLVTFIRRIVKLVLPSRIPINNYALGILNECFVKRKIEKEEYEECKKVLLS